MTSWLVTSETILAQSRSPNGDLDYERAKMHQDVSIRLFYANKANLLGVNYKKNR